jgi:hypothetical protein
MSIFRDASFKDPWIYIAVMTLIGLIYLAYLLIRHGRHGLAMPDMHSIDAQATAPEPGSAVGTETSTGTSAPAGNAQ